REHDPDGVTAARRDDRVHPDSGEHGPDDRPPADAHSRICALDDVPPGAADGEQPQDVTRDSKHERAPGELPEPVPEDIRRIPDRMDQLALAVLTKRIRARTG